MGGKIGKIAISPSKMFQCRECYQFNWNVMRKNKLISVFFRVKIEKIFIFNFNSISFDEIFFCW